MPSSPPPLKSRLIPPIEEAEISERRTSDGLDVNGMSSEEEGRGEGNHVGLGLVDLKGVRREERRGLKVRRKKEVRE